MLKGLPRYHTITVVVYSIPSHAMDIRKCGLGGAAQYITKPAIYADFALVTAKIKACLLCGDAGTSWIAKKEAC
ncbi:MAG TPA: hypothetical protein VGN63_03900 [Flavisolibacter sp.]|jgi:hypothetical protein|nr:hypothetical protein [Flavisolibacter sp.]